MARSSSRKKFGKVARAANAKCHRDTNSVSSFKTCMSREMKAGLRAEGFKVGGKKRRKR